MPTKKKTTKSTKRTRKNRIQLLTLASLVSGILLGGIIVMEALYARNQFPVTNARQKEGPRLYTNEQFLDDIKNHRIDITNIDNVFSYVYSQLPETVNVYPTENYYYFKFNDGGRSIWGNIRLGVTDRESGNVSFAYFTSAKNGEYKITSKKYSQHKDYGTDDGVNLTKVDDFTYRLSYNNKDVTFNLHQLDQSQPENLQLRENEIFHSRTFDESGFQFLLLYDKQNPSFRFVLDESSPVPDTLHNIADNIYVGRLSSFAFYEDETGQKSLIGVQSRNTRVNNYYDGPFDQLADNFVTDDTFKKYVEAAYPGLKGKVTRHGIFLDEEGNKKSSRVLLSPYTTYYTTAQITELVQTCKEQSETQRSIISCVTKDDKQES